MRISGEPLSYLRKINKLSTEQLASLSGVSERTIETIESGNGNSTYETLCLLSDALNTPIDILCGRNLDKYFIREENGNLQIIYDEKDNKASYDRIISYLQWHKSWQTDE